jgi:hypothetical protein
LGTEIKPMASYMQEIQDLDDQREAILNRHDASI